MVVAKDDALAAYQLALQIVAEQIAAVSPVVPLSKAMVVV